MSIEETSSYRDFEAIYDYYEWLEGEQLTWLEEEQMNWEADQAFEFYC